MPNNMVTVRITPGSTPAAVENTLRTAMAITRDAGRIRIISSMVSLPPPPAEQQWITWSGSLVSLLNSPLIQGRCTYFETSLNIPDANMKTVLDTRSTLTVARGRNGDGNNSGVLLALLQKHAPPRPGLNRQIFAEGSFFSVDMGFLIEKGIELPSEIPEGAAATFLAAVIAGRGGSVNVLPRELLGLPGGAVLPRQPPLSSIPPVPGIKGLWDAPDLFARVFPELVDTYNDMKARYSAGGCATCVKNSLTSRLAAALDGVADNRDLTPLGDLGRELAVRWAARSITTAPVATNAWKEKGPRPTCLNCVRKHIGQAIVLLGESLLGYPAHRWIAVGHLGEASEECVERYPELAMKIREIRNRMTDDLAHMPNLIEMFDLVDSHEKRK